ncbi:hypothetical protein BB561_000363 [Smittium simulii]|uniref:Uncharacterized protein n=1 Tax=Smittium simulii TaxID=133385 RepID=A0A2T9YZG5_9FUNG|nr:hypothetical protein BB561_000363 [Smittium simulii]
MDKASTLFITLVTSDSYTIGALVLLESIRLSNSAHKVACLVVKDSLLPDNISSLENNFDYVIPVTKICSSNKKNLKLLGRPDLADSYTKIHLWNSDLFLKNSILLYLDVDTIVLQNVDHLIDLAFTNSKNTGFASEHSLNLQDSNFDGSLLAAAPDMGWPDWFNSGVMLIQPNISTYSKLLDLINQENLSGNKDSNNTISFDGADQGLLNYYFNNWYSSSSTHRLSFLYNVTGSSHYTYTPAILANLENIKIIHFAGQTKPWKYCRFSDGSIHCGGLSSFWASMVTKWWKLHDMFVLSLDLKNRSQSPNLPNATLESSENKFNSNNNQSKIISHVKSGMLLEYNKMTEDFGLVENAWDSCIELKQLNGSHEAKNCSEVTILQNSPDDLTSKKLDTLKHTISDNHEIEHVNDSAESSNLTLRNFDEIKDYYIDSPINSFFVVSTAKIKEIQQKNIQQDTAINDPITLETTEIKKNLKNIEAINHSKNNSTPTIYLNDTSPIHKNLDYDSSTFKDISNQTPESIKPLSAEKHSVIDFSKANISNKVNEIKTECELQKTCKDTHETIDSPYNSIGTSNIDSFWDLHYHLSKSLRLSDSKEKSKQQDLDKTKQILLEKLQKDINEATDLSYETEESENNTAEIVEKLLVTHHKFILELLSLHIGSEYSGYEPVLCTVNNNEEQDSELGGHNGKKLVVNTFIEKKLSDPSGITKRLDFKIRTEYIPPLNFAG